MLERVINEQTGKLYTVIRVDDVRRAVPFFGSTAGEGGWRIAIVDAVDDLQREGANALLKVLEEPPPRTLLLLVSHAPGRELPTIRSRCRRLLLRPLDAADVARAVAAATGRDADDAEVQRGSGRRRRQRRPRAIGLLDGPALALRQRVLDLFAQLPDPDPRALHALGDALGGSEPQTLAAFMDMVNGWLSARLAGERARRGKWRAPPRSGRRSTAPRATSRPTISNASRWCSRCSACWRKRRGREAPALFGERARRQCRILRCNFCRAARRAVACAKRFHAATGNSTIAGIGSSSAKFAESQRLAEDSPDNRARSDCRPRIS